MKRESHDMSIPTGQDDKEAKKEPREEAVPPRVESELPEKDKRKKAIPPNGDGCPDAYKEFVQNYWCNLANISQSTFNNTLKTFNFSYYLGILLASLGTIILLFALNDMRNGVKLENTLAGAIGIGAVVSQFFYGPQNRVTKSLGDYVQIQIINNTYTLISQAWNNWDNAKGQGTYRLSELSELMKLIVDNSIRLISEIEVKIGEVEAPDLKVTSLTLDPEKDTKVGEELKVEAKVTNVGTKSGTKTFTLLLDGEETDKKEEFTLEPGEMKSHTFTLKPDKAKEYAVRVGDLTKNFTAMEKIKVSELKANPVGGDLSKYQLSAKFTNPNNAEFKDDFQILLNGKSLEEKWSVDLQANEAKTLTKKISVGTDKEQKVKIGDVEVTFTL